MRFIRLSEHKVPYALDALFRLYLEDRRDIQLVDEIQRRIDSGQERLFTIEEVEACLELADEKYCVQ